MKQLARKIWPNGGVTRVLMVMAVLLIVGAVLSWLGWDWLRRETSMTASNGETARNVGFLIAGSLALVFGVWRAIVAERQAKASQGQTETAQKGLLNERYQRGAEMLGSETLAVRLGGIYALKRLADERPEDYHIQCMELLSAFVRNSDSNKLGYVSSYVPFPSYVASPNYFPPLRDDVQAAITAVGTRKETGRELELESNFTLDLHGSDLIGANLRGAELARSDLSGACLVHADLRNARLHLVDLTKTDLRYAELTGADCSNSVAIVATFQSCNSRWASFSHANLTVIAQRKGVRKMSASWRFHRRLPALIATTNHLGVELPMGGSDEGIGLCSVVRFTATLCGVGKWMGLQAGRRGLLALQAKCDNVDRLGAAWESYSA